MLVIPFEISHLDDIELQPAQAWMKPMFSSLEYRNAIQASGPCFSGVCQGQVIGCAGLTPIWEGRAAVWAFLSCHARKGMISLVRAMNRFLSIQPFRRIDAFVQSDFEQGHRMIRLLGFSPEGHLRAFLPNGADCVMYGRIK